MESLGRLGRSQVLGTLFLLFAAVLLFPYESKLNLILPSAESPSTEFFTRVAILVSTGFFVGFVFEHSLEPVGALITRFVCETTQNKARKDEFKQKVEDLALVLKGEPTLPIAILPKPALGRFMAVARYLSQERFKDFPELSPLRAFEQAVAYSTASAIFIGLTSLGAISILVFGSSNLDGTRVLALLLCAVLALLLWADARANHAEGYRSTLVSLREKRQEAARTEKETTERQQTIDQTQRLAQLEAENRRLVVERDVLAALTDLDSDIPGARMVAVTKLQEAILRNAELFDRPGVLLDHLEKALGLGINLQRRHDMAALETFLVLSSAALRQTNNIETYERLERVLTPQLVEIMGQAIAELPIAARAIDTASYLRSGELVEAIFSRIAAVNPEKEVPHFRLDQTLGASVLGFVNRDRVEAKLRDFPEFAKNDILRGIAQTVLMRMNRPEENRGIWPRALQSVYRSVNV